jgi:membrane-bound lytic murein transglycosylase B
LAATPRDDSPLKRDDVLALQRALASLGFLKREPDGVVGSATRQAVRAFQRSAGLPPDGYIDARLIAAVNSQAPAA